MTKAEDAAGAADRAEQLQPDLSVIVVSYNTVELTRRCLQSVQAHAGRISTEIVVVDNASADGSAEMVRREFPGARLIANPDNRGFAAANNQAFAVARGRFVLLLNPDTEVLESTLESALDFAERHPEAGAIGCRVRYPDGSQQSTIFRYQRLSTVLLNVVMPNRWIRRSRWLGRSRYVGADLDAVQDVEAVAGCFMLVPRRVLETVGGMDEDFFMYGEEAEWCFRIRRANFSVLYYPDATILHHGGQSARQRPGPMLRAMARSQLRFLEKTQGPVAAYAANFLMLLRDLPRAALWQILALSPRARSWRGFQVLASAKERVGLHVRGVFGRPWHGSGMAPVPRDGRG